jgi:hypothetical protein
MTFQFIVRSFFDVRCRVVPIFVHKQSRRTVKKRLRIKRKINCIMTLEFKLAYTSRIKSTIGNIKKFKSDFLNIFFKKR